MNSNFRMFIMYFILLGVASFLNAQTHNLEFSAPDPQDSVVQPLLGVIAGPDPNCPDNGPMLPNLSSQYQDIGVMFVRNNDYYDDRLDMERMFRCADTTTYPSWRCDPNDPDNLHFDGSDEQFQSYWDGGFIPFFRLGGEYENCQYGHDYKGPRDSLEEANWIQAALHVIEHYNTFNNQENVLTYLDIWTEFPGPHFWSRSNAEFYDFWARVYDSVKTHFPHLLVGGPGFVPKATLDIINGELNSVPVDFLTTLYERNIRPDWIGWHYWHNDPSTFMQAARQFRDLLNGEGDFSTVPWAGTGFFSDVKQYVDAYGASVTEYVDGEIVSYDKVTRDSIYNKQKGAAIITGQWIAMQYTEVELACYYRGSPQGDSGPDVDPRDPNSRISGASLFYGDAEGTAKPTAHAFRLWSRLYQEFPVLLQGPVVSQNTDGKELWILAAKNDNQYAVLISNLNSAAQEYTITLEGKAVNLNNFESVAIYEVTDTNDGRTPRQWNGRALVIPGYTVQLLVLTPKVVSISSKQTKQPAQFTVRAAGVVQNRTLRLTVSSPIATVNTLTIFNVLGQPVFTMSGIEFPGGIHQWEVSLPQLPTGMYFARLQNQQAVQRWKFLIRH